MSNPVLGARDRNQAGMMYLGSTVIVAGIQDTWGNYQELRLEMSVWKVL